MLGLQLYTLRKVIGNESEAVAALKTVKEIGYECVQLAGTLDTVELTAMAAQSAGLPVVGILVDMKTCEEEEDRLFALATRYGAEDIGISSGIKTDAEAYDLIRRVNVFARKAKEKGFTFSYHNHSNEWIRGESGRPLMELLIEGFDPTFVNFMPDTYWLQHGGADIRSFLYRIRGRARILHLKDMKRMSDGTQTFSEIGRGNIDFSEVLKTARQIGVKHLIVEQDRCEGDPVDSIRKSYEHITQNLLPQLDREGLYLGVARRSITPEVGACLYGYEPDFYSESVHDDLSATVFFFQEGEKKALAISATLCLISTAICDEVLSIIEEKYGIPKTNCMLHATHTHSGPNLSGTYGWGDIDQTYYETVFLPAILSAVGEAVSAPVPVTMGIAEGNSYAGVNRRELSLETNRAKLGQNPWGAFNPKMTVVSFFGQDGKVVANLIHYGMHGTCAGRSREISRDWAGYMTDALEAESGAITAFFNGPEGDVGPRLTNGDTTGHGDMRHVERTGCLAAMDALRIFRSIRSHEQADLSVALEDLELPLTKRIDLETAKTEYEKYRWQTVNLGGAKAKYYAEQIRLYEEGYEERSARRISQTLIRIGNLALISFPYEVFSEIGMRIANASSVPYTLSLSNTNGNEGYFVTEDQICRGGYEVDMFKTSYIQPYADNADWHMVRGTLQNLEKMKDKE